MEPKMAMEVGLEECMYCHGNTNPNATCPVCGAVRPADEEAPRRGQKNLPQLDFNSKVLVQPQIAGI